MRSARFAAAAVLFLGAIAVPGAASAQTKVRFTLDWIPGATHGAFLIALTFRPFPKDQAASGSMIVEGPAAPKLQT